MPVTSQIKKYNNLPRLCINDVPVPPVAYMTYLTERNRYADFAGAGYQLFSVPVFFAGRGINAISHISPFDKGIYDCKGKPDFGLVDRAVGRILEAAPDGFVFPRVNMSMPVWWCEENPEACNLEGVDGEAPRECFSSEKWREDASRMLEQLIRHMENSSYKDHVIGYQLAGGNTEEWFSFDGKGSVGKAAIDRFVNQYGREAGQAQWHRFLSLVVAEAIDHFAAIVKEVTEHRLVVGCFYGYTLEVPDPGSCHHALEYLLGSENLDFFCAPSSYMGLRSPGRDWACMTALDSVARNGKLFFTEYDTRTYLTRSLGEAREHACVPGTYEGGVWQGPGSKWVSRQLLKNNMARQLTHGTGSWWFDMWGGWYADEDLMGDMAAYRRYAELSLELPGVNDCQVAVVVDERAYSLLGADSHLGGLCYESRGPLGLSGVPYGIYEAGDFHAIADDYRAFVFLMPGKTDRMKEMLAECHERNLPVLEVTEETMPLTVEKLHQFYRENKIHIWCDSGDVFYVGNGFLSIHGAEAGVKEIHFPGSFAVQELGGNHEKEIRDKKLIISIEQYETRLYRLIPAGDGAENHNGMDR